jgi:glycosyltransferase involved in cell wall biosynthesis
LGVIPNRRTPFTEVNFPTRIFEYLAMGKPVIVPETRGIRDYFDKTQMLFFNPDDSADLARVIKWVAEHPDETATIVERGREAYRRHLWDEEKIRFLDSVSAMFENRKNLQIEK